MTRGADPRPRLRLYHLTHTRSTIGQTEFHYLTYPLPVDRPPSGVAARTARCGYCGSAVQLRVYAGARTRLALARWLLLAGCGLVLAVVTVVVTGSLPADPARIPHDGLVTGSLVVAGVLGILAAPTGVVGWRYEAGVRVVRTEDGSQRGRHLVRPDRARR